MSDRAIDKYKDSAKRAVDRWKAKGVPLGKGAFITPNVKFDLKAMSMKEASLKITWRF